MVKFRNIHGLLATTLLVIIINQRFCVCIEEVTCITRPSSVTLFCPTSQFIIIQSVHVGRSPSSDDTFCNFPSRRNDHCYRQALGVEETFKECNTFSTCSRVVSRDAAQNECDNSFTGDSYVVVVYSCANRTTSSGSTIEFVDMATSRSVSVVQSSLYLITQHYPTHNTEPRAVCRLRPIQKNQDQILKIEILDYSDRSVLNNGVFSTECYYKVLVLDGLGTEITMTTYCRKNITKEIIIRGSGSRKADAMAQIVFLKNMDNSQGKLWVKIQVLSSTGNSIDSGISVDCDPNMLLLTESTTTTSTTTTTTSTSTTSSTTSTPTTTSTSKATTTPSTTTTTAQSPKPPANPLSPSPRLTKTTELAENMTTIDSLMVNNEDEKQDRKMFWYYVGGGAGAALLLLIIIIVASARCYSNSGDAHKPTIKDTDIIDGWDESSTLGKRRLSSKKRKNSNKKPPNMCANVYADIPAKAPPPSAKSLDRRDTNATIRSSHSSYSFNSAAPLWDGYTSSQDIQRQNSINSFAGTNNIGYGPPTEAPFAPPSPPPPPVSQTPPPHAYSTSWENGSNPYPTMPHSYSRQYSNTSANSTSTFRSNGYSRQDSTASMLSRQSQDGFRTLPAQRRPTSKPPPPPIYPKPLKPPRTSSLEKVAPQYSPQENGDISTSQLSLYGYSTSLPL